MLALETMSRKEFSKLHVVCECISEELVIYDWVLTSGRAPDAPYLPGLVAGASRFGGIGYVCADSAYASRANVQAIEDLGGTPVIKPRSHHTPRPGGCGGWKRMVKWFRGRPRSFSRRFSRRAMVETVNSTFKRKWGSDLRGKSISSQSCEAGFKVIAYNLREKLRGQIRRELEVKN